MRLMLVAMFACLIAASASADTVFHCAAAWKAMTPAERGFMTEGQWSTKCLATGFKAP